MGPIDGDQETAYKQILADSSSPFQLGEEWNKHLPLPS